MPAPHFPSNLKISLGPRPGKKSLERLQSLHLTHCCTLLAEREDVTPIQKICTKLGTDDRLCDWVWLPVEGGNLEVLRQTDVASLIAKLQTALIGTAEPHVYLHCSAGIHRTGFLAYILLRFIGHNPPSALLELAKLREVTSNQVGEDRIELAEEFVQNLTS